MNSLDKDRTPFKVRKKVHHAQENGGTEESYPKKPGKKKGSQKPHRYLSQQMGKE